MKSRTVDLILIGASVRAAAFSALRAGLRPWCADLFADADLRIHCPCRQIDKNAYPRGFTAILQNAPDVPWMYTGGLENHPTLLRKLAAMRPMWGNDGATVKKVRNPLTLFTQFQSRQIPCPKVIYPPGELASRSARVRLSLKPEAQAKARRKKPFARMSGFVIKGQWLVKPVKSAGGNRIHFQDPRESLPRGKSVYLQEFLRGTSCSALYLGIGQQAILIGVTRQLVGENWLHAPAFSYCGSIGPLNLSSQLRERFQRIGAALVSDFHLQGLFGVDCILQGDIPLPVEINPRYTASAEVLELASRVPVLKWHRRAFTKAGKNEPMPMLKTSGMIGKAIFFAPADFTFPGSGPWQEELQKPRVLWQIPTYADIPVAGMRIAAHHPVLTVFSSGENEGECLAGLRQVSVELHDYLGCSTRGVHSRK